MPDGGSAESRERKRRFQQIQICLRLSQPELLPGLELLPEQGGCRITVYEGKYHMVKRMLAGCGTPVLQLHRLSIGALTLDPALSPGAYRELQPAEAMLVFSLPAS